MNCIDCKYCGTVPGSAHKSCNVLKEVSPEHGDTVGLLISMGGAMIEQTDDNGIKSPAVKMNPIGVQGGWCMWPINFDPCWIDECIFYKDKT